MPKKITSVKDNFLQELFNLCKKYKASVSSAKVEFEDDNYPLTIDFVEGKYPILVGLNAVEACEEVTTIRKNYVIHGDRDDTATSKKAKSSSISSAALDSYIFGLVRDNPNETAKIIHRRVSKADSASISDIYQSLGRLQTQGLIASSLTDKMLKELNDSHEKLVKWVANGGHGERPYTNKQSPITWKVAPKKKK